MTNDVVLCITLDFRSALGNGRQKIDRDVWAMYRMNAAVMCSYQLSDALAKALSAFAPP